MNLDAVLDLLMALQLLSLALFLVLLFTIPLPQHWRPGRHRRVAATPTSTTKES